ncbi:MAG: coproporphyrinogen-III oxidase family protein [Tissierellia bacterium]|nr:coproporphyrinogen-III oxidase family protein [Tissierellia bacterium]
MDRGLKRFKKRKKDHHSSRDGAYVTRPISLEKTLKNLPPAPENNIIYFHIPYCSKICSFCNMRRGLGFPTKEYTETLLQHIKILGRQKGLQVPIDSIYFGGGTPSTLETEDIYKTLDTLYENFPIRKDAEISLETSLTELSPKKLEILKNHGINRISVGVQTFSDSGRKLFQRRGTGEFARKRLWEYRDLGFENINIDFIYNYPGEKTEEFERDLMTFKELDLAGFSLYSLMVMPGSVMEQVISKEKLSEEERIKKDMEFFQKALEIREREGWEQLELTKIVKPGRDEYKYIRHRLNQGWTIPIGAGAGGTIGHTMFMGNIDVEKYAESVGQLLQTKGMAFKDLYFQQKAILNPLQLGYLWKKDLEESPLLEEVKVLIDEGYFTEDKDRYYLTDIGLFWGNSISEYLWDLFPKPKKSLMTKGMMKMMGKGRTKY